MIFLGSAALEISEGPDFSVCPAMKLRNHKN